MKNSAESTPLKKERELTDESLTVERVKTDESLIDETKKTETKTEASLAAKKELAEKNSQIETLLSQREETDKNLHSERVKTDLQASKAAVKLRDEKLDHLETKAQLTSRDEFLAIVSHDLRNPIGAIFSSAEILLADLESLSSPEKSRTWLDRIKRNAELSLRIISDILDLERIAQGKLELNKKPNNMTEMISETISNLSYIADSKKISVKSLSSNISKEISCDHDRIIQVLSNLIGNALKFTPLNGTINITTELKKDEIAVSIVDSGPGIPEDQQQNIFNRYAQLQNNNRQGLGLGLYIAKFLVELHGGQMTVASTVGKGSTFSFTLPT